MRNIIIIALLFIIGISFSQETDSTELSFDDFGAEFESISDSELEDISTSTHSCSTIAGMPKGLYYSLIALSMTLIAGIFVKFKALRKFRYLFLLSSLIVFGFWNGGCPCSISSFQNVFLKIFGATVNWHSLVWFLGLIPITYIFGKVWCGWVCHLGAFQEFLYRITDVKIVKSKGFQKSLKILQYSVFVILVIQLFVTKTNIFIHYDPFKVAFNMISFHTSGWVLLGILLVSSLFIYRPFCKGFCPVGLALGWVGKIPGAHKLQIAGSCTSCKSCIRHCDMQAISDDYKADSHSCILCGDCLDYCKKESIKVTHKGLQNEKNIDLVVPDFKLETIDSERLS